mgnify:CR=1 FL=1
MSVKKFLAILMAASLLSLSAACQSSSQGGNSSAAGSSASSSAGSSASSSSTESSSQTFDPDSEKDKIDYSQLETKFGAVPKATKSINVGAVEKTLANEYWQLLAQGYKSQGTKLGMSVDVQAAQNESDQAGQLSIAESMLAKNYDALLVSPQTNSNLSPAIDKARAAKVPVINVDDALTADSDVFVGNDQKDNGVNAAKYIAEKIGNSGQVACIEGQAGVYATTERTAGFKETIAQYSDIKLVASVTASWDRQKAMDTATTIMNQYPDVKAFYCNNDDMALGVVEAVKSADKLGKVIVIGTDGISEALKSIKAGELTGTVDSFPEKTGEIAMEVAARMIGGQKMPRVITTPQALIDKDNMAKYGIN